jgi:hypothetical protein
MIVSHLAIFGSLFLFWRSLSLSPLSLVPLALMGLSLLQMLLFKEQGETDTRLDTTAYSLHEDGLTAHDHARLMQLHRDARAIVLPLLAVFCLYFGAIVKVVAPLAIYALSFVAVRVVFLWQNKRNAPKGDTE